MPNTAIDGKLSFAFLVKASKRCNVYWLLFYAQITILPKAPKPRYDDRCVGSYVCQQSKKLATLRKGAASKSEY